MGLEWWRYAWGPILAAGLVWLASTWKTTSDTRGARDARLDSRQEREITRLDKDNEELRATVDQVTGLARGAVQYAHDRRHEHIALVSTIISFRDLVRGFLAGVVPREKVEQAISELNPEVPPKVPPLHKMAD
jgi:hypothetical protein